MMMKGRFVALDDLVRDFLNDPKRFAVLATVNPNGLPQQTVMWYALLDDNTIMMNTKRGRQKDRNLLREPRASLCIEDGLHFVTLTGRVTMIDDRQRAQADIRALAVKYDGEASANQQVINQFSKEERVTLLFSIEKVYTHGL
jgi:PPOX class probable F420-dependent enzyme